MTRVAALQMYTTPALAPAIDVWWTGLADHMRAGGMTDLPEGLIAPDDIHSVWHRDDLLLSQTCGGPLIRELGDTVRIIGTPVYDSPYTEGMHYRSAIVTGHDHPAVSLADLKGTRLAINGRESYSGFFALKATLADIATPGEAFFSRVSISGTHRESLHMVASGQADCAAIDGITMAIAERDEPDLISAIRVIGTTDAVPGLPYITGGSTPDDEFIAIRQAVQAAVADPALADARAQMLLREIVETSHDDYAPVAAMIEHGRNVDL